MSGNSATIDSQPGNSLSNTQDAPIVRLIAPENLPDFIAALQPRRQASPAEDLRWLPLLQHAFGHQPYLLEASRDDRIVGRLRLACVSSWLFGRFLVSLPYVNSAGVVAEDESAARALIDRAVGLAETLDCRFLELRHESPLEHPRLNGSLTTKAHLRLNLPENSDELMASLKSKVRSQLRSGLKRNFTVAWGGVDLLPDFYRIFSRRMRDLGTPVYSSRLFRCILQQFGSDSEICCLRYDGVAVAAALLIHGRCVTEVPSAAALTRYNPLNANMVMYWHLLKRAVERGQQTFDFGRSTIGSNTFRFKRQWGAEPHPAHWQYFVRRGSADMLRPDQKRNRRLSALWTRLPLSVANWLGPRIVRGIP